MWREEGREEDEYPNPEDDPEEYRIDFFNPEECKNDEEDKECKKHIHVRWRDREWCCDLGDDAF